MFLTLTCPAAINSADWTNTWVKSKVKMHISANNMWWDQDLPPASRTRIVSGFPQWPPAFWNGKSLDQPGLFSEWPTYKNGTITGEKSGSEMCPVWWGENAPEAQASVQALPGQGCMTLLMAEGTPNGAKSGDIYIWWKPDPEYAVSQMEPKVPLPKIWRRWAQPRTTLWNFLSGPVGPLTWTQFYIFLERPNYGNLQCSLPTTLSSSTAIGQNNYVCTIYLFN